MKNLKRALSFALATVMVIGMMVVGAGAAFTDADKIENDAAVDAMVALNVLNGKGDGTYFDPTGTLTRAEAAKIIVYVLHGGKAPVIGTKTTPTYSDIKGNWAESYIEYCSSLGIIAGYEGKFNPTGELTGAAFAKMLMVAMGYNAEVFGFVGNDWEMNVNIEANKIGLYEELDAIDPAAKISRDDAAQLAYNALTVGTMTKTYTHDIMSGAVTNGYEFKTGNGNTLLDKKFGAFEAEGQLVDVAWNSDKKEYTYSVDGNEIVSTKDYTALIGLEVKALYKVASDGTKTAYGLFSNCNTVVATVGQMEAVAGEAKQAKFAGTVYKLENNYVDTNIYVFDNDTGVVDFNKDLDDCDATKASTLTLVDADKNGKYDYAIVLPVTVQQVSYVGKTSVTAGSNYKYEDETIEAGLAKNDYVTIINEDNTVYDKFVIAKAPVITGKVTGIKSTDSILVDGKWYADAATVSLVPELEKTYEFVAIGAYYYSLELVNDDAVIDNLVVAIAEESVGGMGTQEVKFLTSAGETVIKTVTKIDDVTVSGGGVDSTGATMYTYKEKNGAWELTVVDADNDLGYTFDGTTDPDFDTKTTTSPAVFDSNPVYYIADDAVVFVKYTATSVKNKVITGAALNAWNADQTLSNVSFLYKTVNGLDYVVAATINLGGANLPGATGAEKFGYIVSVPYYVEIAEETYACYDIWTGSEKVTVYDEYTTALYTKGYVVKYEDLGNGYINSGNYGAVVGQTTGAAAVMGYTDKTVKVGDYDLANDTAVAYAIDEDTVIMYVDTKAVAGVEGGAIAMAAKDENGKYVCNVWYTLNGGAFELIVVDVNNDLYHATTDWKTAG